MIIKISVKNEKVFCFIFLFCYS